MGIKNLTTLLKKFSPNSFRVLDIFNLSNQTVSCDASITMYQFLFSTIYLTKKNEIVHPQDKEGNSSGHILGLIYRSLFLMESKIKPIWVFDGIPPDEKNDVLVKRMNNIAESEELMNDSLNDSDFQSAIKYKVKSLRITEQMKDDAKKLVHFLGAPYILSPGEAEAQCAYLTNMNEVYGTVSEDSDCLVFGSKKMIKGLIGSDKSNKKAIEIDLSMMLKEMNLDMKAFIDLCILCGTDYNQNIRNMGSITAYKYIHEYGNIENILKEIIEKQKSNVKKKFIVPENFDYKKIRKLFTNPKIKEVSLEELEWKKPDIKGLENFLNYEKGFSSNRTNNIIKRLNNLKFF